MTIASTKRPRVLFVAEAVTLAHVARPIVLAQALDPNRYDIYFAADPRYDELFPQLPFQRRRLTSISSDQFLDRLARGARVYDAATLRSYVTEDLELLNDIKPDLVVGDFRLSLAVSARVSGTPYVTLSNAYWSPFGQQRFPLPDLPMTKFLGVGLSRVLFQLVHPLAFAYHCLPLNRLRREYGLSSLGFDLRRIYTDADYTLYADVPQLVPTYNLPDNHQYLGPILWSPTVPPPAWWDYLPTDRPMVYVTFGSSGPRRLLTTVVEALSDVPVVVIAASAGRRQTLSTAENVFLADYLPGTDAAQRANLVICNGGSPTTQQALAVGKPVLGIATNMDQYLNMEAVERTGAGTLLRSDTADRQDIRRALCNILERPKYADAASNLARVFARYPAPERFRQFVSSLLSPTANTPPPVQLGGHLHASE